MTQADLLPDYLRRWRKRLGFTQAQVGAALGVRDVQVSKWERGEKAVPMERMFQLSDFYGLPVAALLTDPDAVDLNALAGDADDSMRQELAALVQSYMRTRKKSTL